MEYVEGRTLTQWMRDQPRADLQAVRAVVEQVARGLRALHRLEMLHQDLRPENVMIATHGTAKIIDLGSAHVAGIAEMGERDTDALLGTAQYTAPEYFLGEAPSPASDLFSLAVITYQMLTGHLPYGTGVAATRSVRDQAALRYRSLADDRPDLPSWIDEALRKALQPRPAKRYQDVDEFVFSLRQPDPAFRLHRRLPLIERNPVVFWKGLSLLLALACLLLVGIAARA
jgi:serine/threonine protein kinase